MTRHPSTTCPPRCPLRGTTCYASTGPVSWHWRDLDEGRRGRPWESFLDAIRALPTGRPFRGCETGDQVPLPGDPARIDRDKLTELARALGGRPAWTYTHYLCSGEGRVASWNRTAVRRAGRLGYVVRVSTENPEEAQELVGRGLKVALVRPSDYGGSDVCTALTRPGSRCIECQRCRGDEAIIAFPAHGQRAKALTASLR